MLGIQRKFGRLTTKRTADDSQVAVLMKDFEDADMLLTKIIEHTKSWLDAWTSIATFQSRMADDFDGLYAPIAGSSETPTQRQNYETPRAILARTNRLRRDYDDLRTDMIQELGEVQARMIQPAQAAKDFLAPVKKTIKKRNDKKTDFERYQSKVDGLIHKQKRSDRDNANLAKAEAELASAKDYYRAADHDLCQRLPTLISLLFSLGPYILRAQIEIQNRLLAHYYTVLHAYCEDVGFPSPPPPMDQVIRDCELASQPAETEVEALSMLAHGKALRQYNEAQEKQQGSKRPSMGRPSMSNLSIASRASGSTNRGRSPAPPPSMFNKPKPCGFEASRSVSPSSSIMTPTPSISVLSSSSVSTAPTGSDYFTPPVPSEPYPISSYKRSPSPMPMKPPKPSGIQFAPAGPKIDHHQAFVSGNPAALDPLASLAGKKKRPPPPPPAKPAKPPRPVTTFVTAMYDFGGHGPDDLSFREGDRIKLVRKTGSTDDWWEGELAGVQGFFPANYVEL
ncbi:uncharacterized protein N7483_002714 [Penicillium malachiteum]|uniref:uncharacterized protein n=1 Tax=Penicillium malachiteum TaxID=1324776 RepID=UPI0025478179|nr:uncharacterized protein N7483_002714 [Penicillium malachiteum]KAJ5737589.1 hypothetical protein N7483_002714 [Penicillium malachiteum]